ncbi:MAG: hypothetical protein ACRDA5_15385 [Clostridium sp.]
MKKLLLILIGTLSLLLYSCSNTTNSTEKYIKSLGYTIKSNNGELEEYKLTKEKLITQPYDIIWGLQEVSPDKYINSTITTYEFIAIADNLKNNSNEIKIYIMIANDTIIGGYSFPNDDSVGSYYSLDGKTLETITGMDLQRWQEEWQKKYK